MLSSPCAKNRKRCGDLHHLRARKPKIPDAQISARPLPKETNRERSDWVILFETSANRDPLLARAQIDIVKNLLENVEHDDTFALITANTRTDVFDPMSRPVREDYVKNAVKFLEESHLIGALDLSKALAAAKPFIDRAKNPYLVHVGAGIPAMGEHRDDVLAKLVNGLRLTPS